jgi:tetraacyldisaccharide 4'-kinase
MSESGQPGRLAKIRRWMGGGLLSLPGAIYGWVVAARIRLYDWGVLKTHRLPGRVISVGNLTVGGTGKTPCVAWIARFLAGEGERVAILSRGYRRESRGRVEVADGERVLVTAREAGDEPWLLARACPGVRVVVDRERYAAGRWLSGRAEVSVFLLDDGYQHLPLARDLNLLLVDAGDPLPSSRMVPRGRLREPLGGVDRADAVIVTRSDQDYDRLALAEWLGRRLRPGTPVFHATHALTGFYELGTGRVVEPRQLAGRPVAAIAGIARPERFYADLRGLGIDLQWTRSFPDHHRYRAADVAAIFDGAAGAEAVLMTEKDAANWPLEVPMARPLLVGRIEFRCREEEALKALLRTVPRR